jgi:hypothetical protein
MVRGVRSTFSSGKSVFFGLGPQPAVFRMKNSTGWPLEADGIDCPDGPDHAGSGNVGLWDIASIGQ